MPGRNAALAFGKQWNTTSSRSWQSTATPGSKTWESNPPRTLAEFSKGWRCARVTKVYIAEADGWVSATFALLIMDNLANGDILQESWKTLPCGVCARARESETQRCKGHPGLPRLRLPSNTARTNAQRFYESFGFIRHGFSFCVGLPSLMNCSSDCSALFHPGQPGVVSVEQCYAGSIRSCIF